ncbi:uncharacterized protein DNG_08023 [Cephalotrichum gorgonifer]|uniref:Protein kinase domain-containing protein n=1 Tax=Cephalotrichum gorgonifer TaxID=2041049 RepID=A0AAE8N2Q0_9PEZI|nr:uncharacterized protein DNG_08023 [Cephalotrichum gorgonifer]
MDYSGYSDYGYSVDASHRSDGAATADERSGTDNPNSHFDIQSFLATALHHNADEEEEWATLVFLSIHLGPWNMFLPRNVYSGASFCVTLLPRRFLIRQTTANLHYFHWVRRLVAIKAPKLGPDDQFSHNFKLLRSLTKEYQILKTEPLAKHKNIVTAYGCCWQTLPTGPAQPTPALILEGTKFGDLLKFRSSRSLTLRERLGLCMDITSALSALHTHGVIHGDLKPNNILIFNSWRIGYTAKVADFGSAILFSQTNGPCRPPPGTRAYRAPECGDESVRLGQDGLVKTDLFSLGITLAFLLVGSHIVDGIMTMPESDLQSLKEENRLAAWIFALGHNDSTQVAVPIKANDFLSWNESSIFADYNVASWFMYLCDALLAADARERPESAEHATMALRYMLRDHLHFLLPRKQEHASKVDGPALKPNFWVKMSDIMEMSKAKIRKLSGEHVPSRATISKREIEAISHCCGRTRSYLKEAKFIIEVNTGKKFRWKRHLKEWRAINSRSLSRRTLIPASVVHLADRMAGYVEESIGGEPSQESTIFWLLPRSVMDLLENQLLQDATDPRNSDSDRASAAYEYAIVIINSKDPTKSRIDNALELLEFAAGNGQVEAQACVGRLSDVFGRPLVASQDEEIEWLLAATRAGSATAQKRFRQLNAVRFNAAIHNIRQENGVICPWLNQALLDKSRRMQQTGELSALIDEAALTGNVELLLKIPPELPQEAYEGENVLGETPLIMACRGGHRLVVDILLARGVNAAHATEYGVTALHFLSAFSDDDIPVVASALLQHGAELDKVCKRELMYKELYDSPFGHSGGTPLLWAVVAGNQCAVRVLLALGADPFVIHQHPRKPGGHAFGESPITRAVTFHQADLLEILLSRSGGDSDLRNRLTSECAEPHSRAT